MLQNNSHHRNTIVIRIIEMYLFENTFEILKQKYSFIQKIILVLNFEHQNFISSYQITSRYSQFDVDQIKRLSRKNGRCIFW